jgi:hypothetical protein
MGGRPKPPLQSMGGRASTCFDQGIENKEQPRRLCEILTQRDFFVFSWDKNSVYSGFR